MQNHNTIFLTLSDNLLLVLKTKSEATNILKFLLQRRASLSNFILKECLSVNTTSQASQKYFTQIILLTKSFIISNLFSWSKQVQSRTILQVH